MNIILLVCVTLQKPWTCLKRKSLCIKKCLKFKNYIQSKLYRLQLYIINDELSYNNLIKMFFFPWWIELIPSHLPNNIYVFFKKLCENFFVSTNIYIFYHWVTALYSMYFSWFPAKCSNPLIQYFFSSAKTSSFNKKWKKCSNRRFCRRNLDGDLDFILWNLCLKDFMLISNQCLGN